MNALSFLPNLGSPTELLRKRESGADCPRANAHIHVPPNFSSFSSLETVFEQAEKEGIGVLGVSNYYDFSIYAPFTGAALEHGIFPLYGLEFIAHDPEWATRRLRINDPNNPGRIYLCGKGLTRFFPLPPEAESQMEKLRQSDGQRITAMIERLNGCLKTAGLDEPLDYSELRERYAERAGAAPATVWLQERHLAEALQELVFVRFPSLEERAAFLAMLYGQPPHAAPDDARATQGELRSRLMKAGRPAFVEETAMEFDDAVRLILQMGGIPCYPILIDGSDPICDFEATPGELVENLKQRGIAMAELIPMRNRLATLIPYVQALQAAGIPLTGGTEHNTPQPQPLRLKTVDTPELPREIEAVFEQGARIVAAHQFLTLHGETGYVDSEGRPNPDFASDAQRVEHFVALGDNVLARFRELYRE